MMNGYRWTTLVCVLALTLAVLAAPQAARACVGKTLLIGSSGSLQQDLLAEMLSVLISERTGTTVKVVRFEGPAPAHQALLQAELDLVVGYTGVEQVEILGREAIADPAALYQAVKQAYNEELNLVWLKPLGFSEPRVAPQGVAAEAAPVVRKDTLKKFPALARLIDKLGGKVSAAAILAMEEEAAGAPARKVVRNFLRQERLI